MKRNEVVDAHCHLFNAQYALMELVAATWNMLWGNYPHRGSGKAKRAVRGIMGVAEGVKEFAAWIARLTQAGLADCEGSYEIERDNFSKSKLADRGPLVVAPLMMDIYYALDDNGGEEAKAGLRRGGEIVLGVFDIPPGREVEFNAHFDSIANLVRGGMQTARRRGIRGGGGPGEEWFEAARRELIAPTAKAQRGGEDDGIELSPGYRKHMRDLEALADQHEGAVLPFLAVDPRRIGIMKLIERKIAKGEGPFKGVKLYPPLGYLPTHPKLQEIFEYCGRWDIPLTVHCSDGGIQNFRKKIYVSDTAEPSRWEDFSRPNSNKSLYFAAPERWVPVLEEWPNLRLNFAHCGGGDNFESGRRMWREKIRVLLTKYPNTYTDCSYFTQTDLPEAVKDAAAKDATLARRLMFGTDYVMMMLDRRVDGLREYFDRFSNLDGNLLTGNARTFLNIKGVDASPREIRLKTR